LFALLTTFSCNLRHYTKVERRQSHPTYWLTVVYETIPPGGNVLTPDRLAYIRQVEDAVRAVAGRCSLTPGFCS